MHHLESIDLFVRETPPDRMLFSIGETADGGKAKAAKKRRPLAILLVRIRLSSDDGRSAEGCSGDRPSFGWLDKRPEREPEEKLDDLLDLVESARGIYLERGKNFDNAFSLWQEASETVMAHARETGAEDLMGSYASALFERAVIDALCRLEKRPFHAMVRANALGIEPGQVHPELQDFPFARIFPEAPRTRFHIRHTVGHSDPIDSAERRIDDGEPETLKEYAERDGLRYFKIKISGDADHDLARLGEIWNRVLSRIEGVSATLDGNESYTDIAAFEDFVDRFAAEQPGLFQHTLFIEQPLTRDLTLNPDTAPLVQRISGKKALAIDEADGKTTAFREAFAIGYDGCSHKNCKGVIKSLLNWALCHHWEATTERRAFLCAEDLSNMPIVPLHQDFATLGVLGVDHCERNGHHYGFGLSHLFPEEKQRVAEAHPDLYVQRGDEHFLDIVDGQVSTASLQGIGFGSGARPDWSQLITLEDWRKKGELL